MEKEDWREGEDAERAGGYQVARNKAIAKNHRNRRPGKPHAVSVPQLGAEHEGDQQVREFQNSSVTSDSSLGF